MSKMLNSDIKKIGTDKVESKMHWGWSNLKGIFRILENLISQYVTGIAIVSIVIGMFAEIILRWSVNISILGLTEITEMLVLMVSFTSLSIVQRADGHVKLDLLSIKLRGRRAGFILGFVISLVSLFLFVFISYCVARHTLIAYKQGNLLTNLYIIQWPFYSIVTAGSVVLTLRLLLQTIEAASKIFRRRDELGDTLM